MSHAGENGREQPRKERGLVDRLYLPHGKRLLDLAVAVPLLVAASPAIAALSLAVRLQMGAPVFFKQERPGLRGRSFFIYKMRTMTNEKGPDGKLLPDADRLTPLGKLIRSSSLDELPQLWNVVRGEMSLVGPRPLLVKYLRRYSTEQARRHDVKPGITGWAQVNGRNAIDWPQKLAHDVYYVDNVSLSMDLRILALTVKHVFRRDGISSGNHATMPEFMGSEPGAP